ncbi:SLC13 family permease [Pseudobacteroides cellulosolvens]|uniref:Citrate transporter n=1 Tax=Pseudobacteroides cellulosolvens ATCC 35603 = DSM 2933 TaxID=398512 RepID=A0A0L6JN53_9FIRM|nr:Citrate transporter [Pseudobacteroides cellulosolvens ATCC 35603 = DSM 2933]
MDSQVIISAVIFIAAYALIVWDKFDRTVIALSGAVLMILFRIITQETAFMEIDYNTLGLLISMMIIIMIMKRTGVFEYLAVKVAKISKGEPVKIIVLLSIITGILSALLDNVTTVLLILPVTLSIAKDLHINPVPFIIAEIFSSNIGGTATLIGDPPNIMIGSSVKISFMDFILNDAPIAIPLLFVTTYLFVLIYRKKLKTTQEAKDKILAMDEYKCIKNHKLLIKSLIVLGLTIIGFLLHGVLHFESATIAITGAVALLLISGLKPEKILHEVEWKTIFFFVGLFIMVGGIKEAGIIKMLAQGVLDITNGDLVLMSLAILWVSAIASAFIDNIPFVATMIPMIKDMGAMSGMELMPIWWALSLGACLGGNGTIIGASANVVATGIADEHGHKITFGGYFKVAFPLMLFTLLIATGYIYFRYLLI